MAEALAAVKVPAQAVHRHDRNGFLVRISIAEVAEQNSLKELIIFRQKMSLATYHHQTQRVFYLTNASVISNSSIWSGLEGLCASRFKYTPQTGYHGAISLGQYLVVFDRAPGWHKMSFPVQRLQKKEEGKVPVWKALLVRADLSRLPLYEIQ